jgi:hypothetical protein
MASWLRLGGSDIPFGAVPVNSSEHFDGLCLSNITIWLADLLLAPPISLLRVAVTLEVSFGVLTPNLEVGVRGRQRPHHHVCKVMILMKSQPG